MRCCPPSHLWVATAEEGLLGSWIWSLDVTSERPLKKTPSIIKQTTQLKTSKEFEQTLYQRRYTKKHMRCLVSIIREITNKTTVSYYYRPISITKSKNRPYQMLVRNMEELLMGTLTGKPFWKTAWQFLKKIKVSVSD